MWQSTDVGCYANLLHGSHSLQRRNTHLQCWQILHSGHCQPARTPGFTSTVGSRQLPW